MEKQLKRLIIGFFIAMLTFTIVSRAAASVMVAKVSVASVSDSRLSYDVSGTGTVKGSSGKYILLQNNCRIAKVEKNVGDTVKKGDVLFRYDLPNLKAQLETLNGELQKLKLQYEKSSLSTVTDNGNLDLQTALLQQSNAKEDLKEAEVALSDIKKTSKKKKLEEYNASKDELADMKAEKDTALKSFQRALKDSADSLAALEEPQMTLNGLLSDYKEAIISRQEETITVRINNIFDFYYQKKYKEHKKEVESAQTNLKRAKEDLADIIRKWDAAINYWDQYSDDPATKKNYVIQIASRNSEVQNGNRAVEDAQSKLNELTDEDTKLNNALQNYRNDLQTNNTQKADGSYQLLYQLILEKLDIKDETLLSAKTKIERAKEDLEDQENEWNEKIAKAQKKADLLSGDLKAMEMGLYDYGNEQREGENAVEAAKRALKTAELSLEKVRTENGIKQENKEQEEKGEAIDLAGLKLDIDKKEAEIHSITAIINKKGYITSPVNGVVSQSGLKYGMLVSENVSFIISTGGYELSMTANEKEMKYFVSGDEVKIRKYNSNTPLTSTLESIGLPDNNGRVTFTALLPEGNYKEGESLGFQLTKTSEEYNKCIPISAIRQGSDNSTYVLLVKERDSVLGKETEAFKINVTVLDKDKNTAAIDASISEKDSIITDSNKFVEEGDRVRLNETE
ncbi:biotin/lipoyl-binding protein [Anaerocolumna chitinilytica]|uniref:Biotin/lipoyl-binding protein n=1 Tax=Anaerocolumna chitinilytica TaxID=1727145 RepID=A0A7I8DTA8_9FIRM|nr:biotin/lipoyl-binding protein [Anaerocolumna chitinilytica]BCK00958.1 hypothetical protein bsdcttw_39980 [Anaerocolumna chitinilytica]